MTQKSIREEFEETFPNIEVRVPIINEYHTGKKAYDSVADWWLSKFSTLLQTIESEIDVEKSKIRCGACDTKISNLSHTIYCHGINRIKAIISKYK